MPAIGFPRNHLVLLHELASRVMDARAVGGDSETLARALLAGFFDVCTRSGLDRVLVELADAFPPLDLTERLSLSEQPELRQALVDKLVNRPDFDDGGPRNAKPRQLAECLIGVLTLTLTDEGEKTITLADDVRADVIQALAGVVDVEFAAAQMRAAIVAKGRELCEERYVDSFDRIAAQLDERGMRMVRQPKVPLDAVQAVQKVLFDARQAVVERAAHIAIDRAKQTLAKANADAAARIDLPISLRLTPRDVAIQRLGETRVPKTPQAVAHSLLESLTELARLAWRPLERPVRVYGASQTFAVGDLVEHPKFGRGSVVSLEARRIDVEFADGVHTLVHVPAK